MCGTLTKYCDIPNTRIESYVMECDVCSVDIELWPLGSITTDKYSMKKGTIPCGCSKATRWSTWQNIIRVKRLLEKSNLVVQSYNSVDKMYTLQCNICSKDTELWGEGSIKSNFCELKRGILPCGCGKGTKWTEHQNLIRLRRVCAYNGYVFVKFTTPYKGVKTRVELYNPVHNETWASSNIEGVLLGYKSPIDSQNTITDKIVIPFSVRESNLKSNGSYPEGTVFEPVQDRNLVKVTCSACAVDEYTLSGVSAPSFIVNIRSAIAGSLACRCNKAYKWSESERLYQIDKRMRMIGGTFVGWQDVYSDCESKFTWVCEKGHTQNSRVCQHKTTTCATCSSSGFSPDKPASIYLVRWFTEGGTFLKGGITNKDVLERLLQQKRASGLTFEIVTTYHNTDGNVIASLEREFKKLRKCGKGVVSKEIFPDGYTETVTDTTLNIIKFKELVSNHKDNSDKNTENK